MDSYDSSAASLPEWDLSDLYPGTTSPAVQQDLAVAATRAKN